MNILLNVKSLGSIFNSNPGYLAQLNIDVSMLIAQVETSEKAKKSAEASLEDLKREIEEIKIQNERTKLETKLERERADLEHSKMQQKTQRVKIEARAENDRRKLKEVEERKLRLPDTRENKDRRRMNEEYVRKLEEEVLTLKNIIKTNEENIIRVTQEGARNLERDMRNLNVEKGSQASHEINNEILKTLENSKMSSSMKKGISLFYNKSLINRSNSGLDPYQLFQFN